MVTLRSEAQLLERRREPLHVFGHQVPAFAGMTLGSGLS